MQQLEEQEEATRLRELRVLRLEKEAELFRQANLARRQSATQQGDEE